MNPKQSFQLFLDRLVDWGLKLIIDVIVINERDKIAMHPVKTKALAEDTNTLNEWIYWLL